MFSFKRHTTRVLNLEPWDYSYCISQAARYQRLAFYWQNRAIRGQRQRVRSLARGDEENDGYRI